ncbi:hypothetical protein COBT_002907, partial [Conglomerata obtusa]
MVRLSVLAAPCFCISVSNTLCIMYRKSSLNKLFVFISCLVYLMHAIRMSLKYSIPNIIIISEENEIMDDFYEAAAWLNEKNGEKCLHVTYADNNTNKWGRIRDIAIILLSDDKNAFQLCKKEGIEYVYIVTGVESGYTRGYLDKEYWIREIACENGAVLCDLNDSIMFKMSHGGNINGFAVVFS